MYGDESFGIWTTCSKCHSEPCVKAGWTEKRELCVKCMQKDDETLTKEKDEKMSKKNHYERKK